MAKGSKKFFKVTAIIFALAIGIGGYFLWDLVLKSNVYLDGKKSKIILIPTGSTYEELLDILYSENTITNHTSFELVAKKMNLADNFKPGRYRIMAGMNNRELVNLFKYGKQEKVKLTFNSVDRTIGDIINDVSEKLEIDKDDLEAYLEDDALLQEKYGLNRETIRTLFIPGNYEMEWTTHIDEFFERMQNEYKKFWTTDRKSKAKAMGYSQSEVVILASIVQCESGIKTEQQKIAGVYVNRIKKNMPLQADPTLIFALGDFTIQRVRNGDKDIDSPYNTYTNKGLPPGPICFPFEQAVDAVLNYSKNDYLYFCAKPDLSGYSDFSASYDQHCKFAVAYQKEMDRRGIKR
jgi:UPF0755 protein